MGVSMGVSMEMPPFEFHQGRCDAGSMQCPHPIKSYLGRARVSQNKIEKGLGDLEYITQLTCKN